jgi:uroporphyrinogen-III synthase
MARPLLLLRPQPGNDATAARARAMGLEVVQAPLFDVIAAEPAPPPERPFDALLLTSANGARFGTDVLTRHAGLPIYAVGAATARAAAPSPVTIGAGDAAGTAAMMAQAGHTLVLHVCGAEVRDFESHGMILVRHIVYRTVETPEAAIRAALDGLAGAVAAVHSPRAGERFAALVSPSERARFAIAAISNAAARACGTGWAAMQVAARPDDTALLQVAEALCISAG